MVVSNFSSSMSSTVFMLSTSSRAAAISLRAFWVSLGTIRVVALPVKFSRDLKDRAVT
jgi:hypothetical protein